MPLIRADLHLSYGQVGVLIGAPLLIGGLLELPLGLVAGYGRRRHLLIIAGGVAVTAALAATATAQTFAVLLLALIAFFPASGAFVSLTQASLMDAEPGSRSRRMAQWNLAGAAGAVCGPLLLALVLWLGGTWRSGYLLLAAAAAAALAGAVAAGPAARPEQADGDGAESAGERPALRAALAALRQPEVARWLVMLQISDLLLDVLTGFVGLYLVDAGKASPAQAAFGIAVRLGAGLLGDAAVVALAGRVSSRTLLLVSAAAAGLLFPAFLIVPGLAAKLAILAALSLATACWYPLLQAGLYDSLPGRSGIAVFLTSGAGLAGAAGPLAVGLTAQALGLTTALGCLAIAPAVIFLCSLTMRTPR
jgi:FSR family fosmidomycin resistance protein-like MFS transporter